MTRTIEIAAFAVVLLFAGLAVHAWLSSRDDQLRLQATLAAQKQLLDAADARERDRTTTLNATLAQIAALKRAVQTPEQILGALSSYLSLPKPLTLASSTPSAPAKQGTGAPPESAPTVASAKQGTAASPNGVPAVPEATQQGTVGCPEGSSLPACSGAPAAKGSKTPVAPAASIAQALPDSPNAQIPAADLKPLYDFVQDCRACQAQLASAKLDAADNATKIAALTRERDAAVTAAKGGSFWLRLRRNVLWFAVGAGAGAVAFCGTGHCRP